MPTLHVYTQSKNKQARNKKRARARMLPYMYARELRKRALTRARTHAPCHAQARSRAIGVPRVKRAGLYVTPLAPDGAVRAGNLAQYRMNMSVATPRMKQTGNASAPWHIPATRARARRAEPHERETRSRATWHRIRSVAMHEHCRAQPAIYRRAMLLPFRHARAYRPRTRAHTQ